MTDAEQGYLTEDRVSRIIHQCVDYKAKVGQVGLIGVYCRLIFNKAELDEHREEIVRCLAQTRDEFHETRGGGDKLCNLGVDRWGRKWTTVPFIKDWLAVLAGAS